MESRYVCDVVPLLVDLVFIIGLLLVRPRLEFLDKSALDAIIKLSATIVSPKSHSLRFGSPLNDIRSAISSGCRSSLPSYRAPLHLFNPLRRPNSNLPLQHLDVLFSKSLFLSLSFGSRNPRRLLHPLHQHPREVQHGPARRLAAR